jgi:hypothetical protein
MIISLAASILIKEYGRLLNKKIKVNPLSKTDVFVTIIAKKKSHI